MTWPRPRPRQGDAAGSPPSRLTSAANTPASIVSAMNLTDASPITDDTPGYVEEELRGYLE